MTYLTEQQAQINMHVNGISTDLGTTGWATFDGGDLTAKTSTILPGGMTPSQAMPGPAERANVTITRPMTKELQPYVQKWDNAVGQKAGGVSYTLKDSDGNVIDGTTVSFTGFLKTVKRSKLDASSGAAQMLEVVWEVDAQTTTS